MSKTRTLLLAAAVAFLPGAARAESTATLRMDAAPGTRFALENLAGTMHVTRGTGPSIVATATVHGEDAALASAVRVDKAERDGRVIWHVAYPESVRHLRLPEPWRHEQSGFLDFDSGSSIEYGGRTVRVSRNHGTLLYVDVDVEVPAGALDAVLSQRVGRLQAEGLEGRLEFSVASADLALRDLQGDLRLEGGSGDISARDIAGNWTSHFGSGDCTIDGFHGERLSFRTGSGDVSADGVSARAIDVRTGSGDARIGGANVEAFTGEAGSGDISLRAEGDRLERITVTTSSGDVRLVLPPATGFEAEARHGSGDVHVAFSDAAEDRRSRGEEHFRRGRATLKIETRTGSGDLTIEPE
jgi:hypothetical protein